MTGLDWVRADDRALSPVVGVLLLLALTVLLGATTASFVVGFSDQKVEDSAPTAKFSFEYQSGSGSDLVTVKHESGDTVTAEYASVVIDGASCVGGPDDPNGRYNLADEFKLPGPEMTAGMTVQIRPNTDFSGSRELCTGGGDLDLSDATVDIVWDDGGSGTTTVYHWAGP